MDRLTRFLLCALVFVLALLVEAVLVMKFVSFLEITGEQVNEFLMLALFWMLIPIVVALAVAVILVWLLVAIALFPARRLWRITSPEARPGSVGAQLEARRECLKKLQAERARIN